jgi:hypothetical protein
MNRSSNKTNKRVILVVSPEERLRASVARNVMITLRDYLACVIWDTQQEMQTLQEWMNLYARNTDELDIIITKLAKMSMDLNFTPLTISAANKFTLTVRNVEIDDWTNPKWPPMVEENQSVPMYVLSAQEEISQQEYRDPIQSMFHNLDPIVVSYHGLKPSMAAQVINNAVKKGVIVMIFTDDKHGDPLLGQEIKIENLSNRIILICDICAQGDNSLLIHNRLAKMSDDELNAAKRKPKKQNPEDSLWEKHRKTVLVLLLVVGLLVVATFAWPQVVTFTTWPLKLARYMAGTQIPAGLWGQSKTVLVPKWAQALGGVFTVGWWALLFFVSLVVYTTLTSE